MSFVRQLARLPAPAIWHDTYGGLVTTTITTRQRPCYWVTSTQLRCYGQPSRPQQKESHEEQSNKPDPSSECDKPKVTPPPSSRPNKLALKHKYTAESVRKDVKSYVFTRYFDYIKNYNAVLEKNFPSAVKVYRVFVNGVTDFYNDMKRYLKITRIANEMPQGIKGLNRKELELYMQMPRDMVKVAPALIGSSLPMVGYAVMPLVFMYPRTFLTRHFWTIQQRAQFQEIILKERLKCFRPVLRCLQSKLSSIKNEVDRRNMESMLGKLGSGFHPSVDDVLEVKGVFAEPPYNILSLTGKHIKNLTKLHGVPGSLFKSFRLREHAFLIHYMDLAITREGGVHNMSSDALRYACFIRGLHPNNLSNEEMIEWLRNWIQVSTAVQVEHLSLFLHLPLFFGYNHTNNWHLLHGDKEKHKQP